jgi:hypothetical protein
MEACTAISSGMITTSMSRILNKNKAPTEVSPTRLRQATTLHTLHVLYVRQSLELKSCENTKI